MENVEVEYPIPNPRGLLLAIIPKQEIQRMVGSIYIPEQSTEQDQPQTYEVLDVGIGQLLQNGEREQIPYEKGDVVVLGGYPTPMHWEGFTWYFVNHEQVLCKLP